MHQVIKLLEKYTETLRHLTNPLHRQTSVRTKVTLGVVLPLIIVLGIFTTFEYLRLRANMMENLSVLATYSGEVIENNLRQAMLESDFDSVQSLLDATTASEEIQLVYLLDKSGRVIFAPHGKGVERQLDNDSPDCLPCHRLFPGERPSSVIVTTSGGQRVFRNMHTIENDPECSGCHDPQERLLGLLLTDIPTAPLEAALAYDLQENILWGAAAILATVLVVNLVISRFVLHRLERLTAAIASFGQGRLPPKINENQPDEIGQLGFAFNKMMQSVKTREAEIRELSEALRRQSDQRGELLKRLITVQENERKRVARELHDVLGQALSGLSLQTKALEHLITLDPDSALQQIDINQALITETTDQMYDLILALRPSALDDLGLAAALRSHADRLLDGTGIDFVINADKLTCRLPPEIETATYRIYQEALNNVVRHSKATEVLITLNHHDGIFEGEIVDNGKGFILEDIKMNGDNPRGLGLMGMRERATLHGGQMEIISKPDGGTRLRILIPIVEITDVRTNPSSDSR